MTTQEGRTKRGGRGRNHCFSGKILGYIPLVNLPNSKKQKKNHDTQSTNLSL
jgi:hypothetical protein